MDIKTSINFTTFIYAIVLALIAGCSMDIHGKNLSQSSCGKMNSQMTDATADVHSFQNARSFKVFSQRVGTTVEVPSYQLRVYFVETLYPSVHTIFEVVGLASGAVAKYFPSGPCPCWDEPPECDSLDVRLFGSSKCHPLVVKWSENEWSSFFNTLHNSGIKEWKHEYHDYGAYDGHTWKIRIFTDNGDTLISSYGSNMNPPNWLEFKNVMDGIITKIKDTTK